MIHLGLFLISLLVVLGCAGMTVSLIAGAFEVHVLLGLVALVVAGAFWLGVVAFVL